MKSKNLDKIARYARQVHRKVQHFKKHKDWKQES